jgi:hypothetical protein
MKRNSADKRLLRRSGSSRPTREVWARCRAGETRPQTTKEGDVLAIAGTGYGLIGLLVIILLVVLIVYFARRA